MAAGIFFLFILLLIIAAWTDLKEGYIPDSVSILIFLLSFCSLFIRSGPGVAFRTKCKFFSRKMQKGAFKRVFISS